jgi:hypothetical protein
VSTTRRNEKRAARKEEEGEEAKRKAYLQEDGLRQLAKLKTFEVFRELISVQPMHLGASEP